MLLLGRLAQLVSRHMKISPSRVFIITTLLHLTAPVKIRTSNLLIRSQMLYPVELRVLRER